MTAGRRRWPSRLGDLLPSVASALGLEEQLRLGRQMATWQRLVEELVPAAGGKTTLLDLQPPALVVSADSQMAAQELRLRQGELLAAFAASPDGQKLLELRVVVRHMPPSGWGRRRV
jgi:hypothetical protein